ncbi:MAG: hypothetical protein HQK62_12280 [Desulfamplus sp.]|nr:hypothetical protein [Desulfamplus sp.]
MKIIGNSDKKRKEPDDFNRTVLDSIPFNIAIVSKTGDIVAVNDAWKNFSEQNDGDPSRTGVGMNYLAVCKAAGENLVHDRLKDILENRIPQFSFEYPCDSPTESRSFNRHYIDFLSCNDLILLLNYALVSK